MKKMLYLILALLLLTGCQANQPEESTQNTAAPESNIRASAESWDGGALYEVHLDIPDLWRFSNFQELGGNILLWTIDCHRANRAVLEMLLVDPVQGTVLEENRLELAGYAKPRVLEDQLYICDQVGKRVYRLDSRLGSMKSWDIEDDGDVWYAGSGTLYSGRWDPSGLTAIDLETGTGKAMFPEADRVEFAEPEGEYLCLTVITGMESRKWMLNLLDGTLQEQPFDADLGYGWRQGDAWVMPLDRDNSICYVSDGAETFRYDVEEGYLQPLPGGYLLETGYGEAPYLRLYTLDGQFVSQCQLCENGGYFTDTSLLWCQELGGYLFRLEGYESNSHLMFWDLGVEVDGVDLIPSAVPDNSDLADLRSRADALEQTYGVQILLGEECDLEYWDFVAQPATDWETVNMGLDELEQALASYPEGFFRQLHWDSVRGVQIQLVQDLQATDDRAGGSYSAFAMWQADSYLVCADILVSNETTYFHEFSHVIDQYLTSCYWAESDTDFELGWTNLNPSGFDYSYSYTADTGWFDYSHHGRYFIDGYATVSPTEDRARVMEYAMMEGGEWNFRDKPGLMAKLEYYCRCIREVFDTTGWPEQARWEQYLNVE